MTQFQRIVRVRPLRNLESDVDYWMSVSPEERIGAVEQIRAEYHGYAETSEDDAARPQLQRVCRVLSRT